MVHNTIILVALLFGMVSYTQQAKNIFDEDYNFNEVDNVDDGLFNFNDPFSMIMDDSPKIT